MTRPNPDEKCPSCGRSACAPFVETQGMHVINACLDEIHDPFVTDFGALVVFVRASRRYFNLKGAGRHVETADDNTDR